MPRTAPPSWCVPAYVAARATPPGSGAQGRRGSARYLIRAARVVTDPERAVVSHGAARCPRCHGRLVGYADVTMHPTIKVGTGGRLSLGRAIDTAAAIAAGVRDAAGEVFNDELRCERACGYTVHARDLREQLRNAG